MVILTRLQLALDDISLGDALRLLKDVRKFIDIVEVGTPFLMEYGAEAIRTIRKEYPELDVLCDGKIMDAGTYEAEIAFKAGAKYVTVLSVTDDATIKSVAETADKYGGYSVADMICVGDQAERVRSLKELGIHIIAVHTGVDQQKLGRTPLDDLRTIKNCSGDTPVSVAGGINEETLHKYLEYNPDIVIVGGGILHSSFPAASAEQIASQIREHNRRIK